MEGAQSTLGFRTLELNDACVQINLTGSQDYLGAKKISSEYLKILKTSQWGSGITGAHFFYDSVDLNSGRLHSKGFMHYLPNPKKPLEGLFVGGSIGDEVCLLS